MHTAIARIAQLSVQSSFRNCCSHTDKATTFALMNIVALSEW